ncbi:hypothetical protein ACFL0T_01750 [Candidatus Omnitrophota bacterium]
MKRPYLIPVVAILGIFLLSVGVSSEAAQSYSANSLSASNLKLKGTLFNRSLSPVAIIEDTRSGQVAMYELGDMLEDLKIVHISRGEVMFETEAGEYQLSFRMGGVSQPRSSSTANNDWYSITRDGNIFTLDKATISEAISRAAELMRDVSVKPYFLDGKRAGLLVSRLNSKGVLNEIGIQPNDVVKTVNGHKLNSPYQIFNAYKKLKDNPEFKVQVLRNNNPTTLTYKVKG